MQKLRSNLRHQRHSISPHNRRKFARKLLAQCQKSGIFRHAKKIASYLPNDAEIDPGYIHNFLKKNKLSIYLPVLHGKKLQFAKIGKKFRPNKFNILEPIQTPLLSINRLNIILLPAVGFDQDKNRLGMGGGYYDRTLSRKKSQKYHTPKLIALAFDCQKTNQLTPNPWDIKPTHIITPSRIYR